MLNLGVNAREAALQVAYATDEQRSEALVKAATSLRSRIEPILKANQQDLQSGKELQLSSAMLDRLALDENRLEGIASSLEAIADLSNPVGEVMAEWERPNGLQIQRVRAPLGVIGVIYESRPNVTADAGALCLKSGNATILRGGSSSIHSSLAIHGCLVEGLDAVGLPRSAIQIVETTDRAAVGEMLSGLNGNLDVIVPRGGKSLVARVQAESRVPVFAHLEGICHVFVDRDADVEMAKNVVLNAKMRRTGICGAAETLLLDAESIDTHLGPILESLYETGCEIRGDESVCAKFTEAIPATSEDWSTEYLAPIISVRTVANVFEAIEHINRYSSGHTESIVTGNRDTAEYFLSHIDSAILLHNASTQFADGGEFGMGAEIGIATGKMHARGPVGVEQLTSFNYRVRGDGQIRPK